MIQKKIGPHTVIDSGTIVLVFEKEFVTSIENGDGNWSVKFKFADVDDYGNRGKSIHAYSHQTETTIVFVGYNEDNKICSSVPGAINNNKQIHIYFMVEVLGDEKRSTRIINYSVICA